MRSRSNGWKIKIIKYYGADRNEWREQQEKSRSRTFLSQIEKQEQIVACQRTPDERNADRAAGKPKPYLYNCKKQEQDKPAKRATIKQKEMRHQNQ